MAQREWILLGVLICIVAKAFLILVFPGKQRPVGLALAVAAQGIATQLLAFALAHDETSLASYTFPAVTPALDKGGRFALAAFIVVVDFAVSIAFIASASWNRRTKVIKALVAISRRPHAAEFRKQLEQLQTRLGTQELQDLRRLCDDPLVGGAAQAVLKEIEGDGG